MKIKSHRHRHRKAKAERSGQSHDAADAESPLYWTRTAAQIEDFRSDSKYYTNPTSGSLFFRPGVLMSGVGARLLVQARAGRTKRRRTKSREKTGKNRERAESETQRRGWQKEKAGCVLMGGTMKNQTSPDFFFTSILGASLA
ncbi:hypothetical protein HDV62DRAFT_136772 [Trichoderma sp. SZMC 28011]